jgi:type II secretory pathway pseudopilin PulG
MEVAIAMGILLILIAASIPFILRYRGKTGVNRAAEITKAVIERAGEEAKTAGYPLPDSLKQAGLTSSSPLSSSTGTDILLRLRRKTAEGEPPQLVLERNLSSASSLTADFQGLGLLDIDVNNSPKGLFLEFVERSPGGAKTVLATIPIDLNGEFVLLGDQGEGSVTYRHDSYSRTVTLSHRGTVVLDRR